jgi:ABC-type amino acid transport substrate-binding protein
LRELALCNIKERSTVTDSNLSTVKVSTADPDPNSARFVDIIILVFVFVGGLSLVTVYYYWGISAEVGRAESSVRSLRERDATLKEKLDNTAGLAALNAADIRVPHPEMQDRDANFIGDHADVTWTFSNASDRKYISYEIQLWRNEPSAHECEAVLVPVALPLSPSEAFWKGCSNGPIKIISTDPASLGSRIPPGLDDSLLAGRYSWRVAPIRAGSNVSITNDDTELLSDWSELSSFNIHRSLLDRILETNAVRVGTNFEQDTHFSRRDEAGHEVGFDISLIRTLIEDCLSLSKERTIQYDKLRCLSAIDAANQTSFKDASKVSCQPSKAKANGTLCITFVPIGSWTGWQSMLKRKEIDLFIGSATSAEARERGGIVFTDGYLTYETKLYVNRMDVANHSSSLSTWLGKERFVGVIDGSTNEDLLDRLIELDFKKRLVKQVYPSFPAVENAMERGDIDGLIIDDTFVKPDRTDWLSLPDLANTQAWGSYQTKYIGRRHASISSAEQIAIAAIRDDIDDSRGLYSALQVALGQTAVRAKFLPGLCKAFWSGSASKCEEATRRR